MITARRSRILTKLFAPYLRYRLGRAFNRISVTPFEPRTGHSILLLCNHFSWWDGFLAGYVCQWKLKRRFHIMMQEDHLKKRMFFNLLGGFSVARRSREALRSLQYAARLLNDPANLVTVFPQGALFSNHAQEVQIEQGIERILKAVSGPCQLIYCCTLIDYFESLRPSAFIHVFDCGLAGEVSRSELAVRINNFHRQALNDQLQVTH